MSRQMRPTLFSSGVGAVLARPASASCCALAKLRPPAGVAPAGPGCGVMGGDCGFFIRGGCSFRVSTLVTSEKGGYFQRKTKAFVQTGCFVPPPAQKGRPRRAAAQRQGAGKARGGAPAPNGWPCTPTRQFLKETARGDANGRALQVAHNSTIACLAGSGGKGQGRALRQVAMPVIPRCRRPANKAAVKRQTKAPRSKLRGAVGQKRKS